ncbi:hypothetical protein FIT72_00460 [Candidatus Methylopumilus universalis]|jgi:hypothetical protein|nr:hypothetical protein FIT72_00460 [Candidatus Methylopumilus universalis]
MTLTRGSHLLSSISLPDASLVLFLIGGIYLKNIRFFIALFLLGLFIDFGAAALDPKLGFCLTKGYWGLIPAYASLWVCGYFLNKQKYLQKLSIFIPYVSIAVVVAFLISTQTYYLFSGRFGSPSLAESLLHGWEYLPQYFLSSFIYIALFWLTQNIIIKNKIFSNLKKFKSL